MNTLVDYSKRSVDLPTGCKDLNDVLEGKGILMSSARSRTTKPAEGLNQWSGSLDTLSFDFAPLFNSAVEPQSLIVTHRNSQLFLVLLRHEGRFSANMSIASTHTQLMKQVSQFLHDRKNIVLRDVLCGKAGAEKRHVRFVLPPDPNDAASLIAAFLRSICFLVGNEAIEFTFFNKIKKSA